MSQERNRQALAEALLPGLGFFGGTEDFALKLDVGAQIDRVVIAIEAGEPEILNIAAIRFHGSDEKEIDREGLLRSASLSTIYGSTTPDEVFSRAVLGQMLHSQREERPSLALTFHEPTEISQIVIFNRGDIYGRRSRFLSLTAFLGDEAVFSFKNTDPSKYVSELADLFAEFDIPDDTDGSQQAAETIRKTLLDRMQAATPSWNAHRLCQLLPMFENRASPTDFELTVCASILLALRGDRPYCATHRLSPLHNILSTDISIERLMVETNRLVELRTGASEKLVASKHRIQSEVLSSYKDKYLSALDTIVPMLEEMGLVALICYGTLLGAVREAGFLAHDDDVDVLYIDGSRSRAEALDRKKQIITRLRDAGCLVWDGGENFQVSLAEASIDLFPCWQEGNRLNLMMERFQYRNIPASIVIPPSTVKLYDRNYPAPADPNAFLKERYGEEWTVSDPFHEWPWTIERRN